MLKRIRLLMALSAVLVLGACATAPKGNDIHANAVKVTNMAKNHGGTGIVLLSTSTNSYILTNAHVCGVVEQGGLVSGPNASAMVTGYKRSKMHDLCLIRVAGDFGYNTKIATRAPNLYYEKASISGHPGLMPNVVSKGHFSGKDVIQILVGVKPCTEEDANDPQKGFICAILGGIPVVKQYESTLVTATIMPGSSGSGVYNSDNELSGVAFAGSGSLGYAWTVPYEEMRNFVFDEAKNLSFEKPSNELDLFGSSSEGKRSEVQFMDRLKRVCRTSTREKLEGICSLADVDILR